MPSEATQWYGFLPWTRGLNSKFALWFWQVVADKSRTHQANNCDAQARHVWSLLLGMTMKYWNILKSSCCRRGWGWPIRWVLENFQSSFRAVCCSCVQTRGKSEDAYQQACLKVHRLCRNSKTKRFLSVTRWVPCKLILQYLPVRNWLSGRDLWSNKLSALKHQK